MATDSTARDANPAPDPARPDTPPTHPGESSRAIAPIALSLGLAALVGSSVALSVALSSPLEHAEARVDSPRPAAVAETLSGSGPIGPWQQLGHAHSPPALTERVAASPRGVLLLGDSSAARIRPALAVELTRLGRPLAWDHWNGRPTHATVDALVALDARGDQPPALAVVSGSNDVFEPALFPVQVERLMRTAGPDRRVYWVAPDVARPATLAADEANSRRLGATLREAAARHPNLRLVNWPGHLDGLNEGERARLVPDGVHPSPAGSDVIAGLLAAALR